MNKKQILLRSIIIIPALILWAMINLYYFWVKIAGGIFIITVLVEIVSFLAVIIGSTILIIRIIRNPEWRSRKNYITIGIVIVVFIALNTKTFQATENTLQSKVKIRACYEGTMNTSHLYFRENGTFEEYSIGWFAYVHYCSGKWKQSGDTMFLDFHRGKSNLLDKTLITKGNYLFKLQSDTLATTYYYLGECKELN